MMSYQSDIREDKRLIKWLGHSTVLQMPDGRGEDDWRAYEHEKAKVWQSLRNDIACEAGIIVADSFQAPSYQHSLWSEAGDRTGKVIGNINDYTRDQHPRAKELEDQLKQAYLGILRRAKIEPIVTCSGMAALSTIIFALQRMGKLNGTIFVGKESYFQNHELLASAANKTVVFDELNLEKLSGLIKKEKPTAMFVDSLCNTENLVCPEISEIARIIRKNSDQKMMFIVDNSLLGPGVNYENIWKQSSGKCEIVIWESLNKFFQYGLDRTTGGVVWSQNTTSREIFYARIHAGTILSDFACAMIPKQSNMIMSSYQERIERNRIILVEQLSEIEKVKIVVAQRKGFSGAQIVISLPNNSVWQIQSIIRRCIAEAKKRGVQLSAGSSFGLPNTRIYLTARKTEFARSFLRISVGWESEIAIREIGEVLKKVLIS